MSAMAEDAKQMARRILVALESSEDSQAALEAAARLAAERGAELVAVFVEDAEYLAAASLPFSRTLNLSTRAWQQLDPEGMRRAMTARADELRRIAEQVARRYEVPWSFRVVQGTARESLAQESRGYELVVVGRSNRMAFGPRPLGGTARYTVTRSSCSVFVLRAPSEEPGRVVAVYRGSPRALEAAEELARMFGRRFEVAVVAGGGANPRELQAEAESWVAGHRVDAKVYTLEASDSDAIAAVLERERGTLAVIDAAAGTLDENALSELLDAVDCPAFVVR